VVAERPRSNRVIQAFSLGVDATFTLLSNKYLNREQGGYDVAAALLVHGFDVAYDNASDFAKLAERAGRALGRTSCWSRWTSSPGWLLWCRRRGYV
jgi:hypothetical protein